VLKISQALGLVDQCLDRLLDLLENGRLQILVENVLDLALVEITSAGAAAWPRACAYSIMVDRD
jgi:hypothetical protein